VGSTHGGERVPLNSASVEEDRVRDECAATLGTENVGNEGCMRDSSAEARAPDFDSGSIALVLVAVDKLVDFAMARR
jgi:hypothetical protein